MAVAFTAGLFSFVSPCVLPLFPSYLSFLTGMSVTDLATDLTWGTLDGSCCMPLPSWWGSHWSLSRWAPRSAPSGSC